MFKSGSRKKWKLIARQQEATAPSSYFTFTFRLRAAHEALPSFMLLKKTACFIIFSRLHEENGGDDQLIKLLSEQVSCFFSVIQLLCNSCWDL